MKKLGKEPKGNARNPESSNGRSSPTNDDGDGDDDSGSGDDDAMRDDDAVLCDGEKFASNLPWPDFDAPMEPVLDFSPAPNTPMEPEEKPEAFAASPPRSPTSCPPLIELQPWGPPNQNFAHPPVNVFPDPIYQNIRSLQDEYISQVSRSHWQQLQLQQQQQQQQQQYLLPHRYPGYQHLKLVETYSHQHLMHYQQQQPQQQQKHMFHPQQHHQQQQHEQLLQQHQLQRQQSHHHHQLHQQQQHQQLQKPHSFIQPPPNFYGTNFYETSPFKRPFPVSEPTSGSKVGRVAGNPAVAASQSHQSHFQNQKPVQEFKTEPSSPQPAISSCSYDWTPNDSSAPVKEEAVPQRDTYLYNEILSSKTSPFATVTTSPPMPTAMPLATATTTRTAAAPDFVTPPSSTANHENHRSFWLKMKDKAADKQDEEKVRILRISFSV